MTKYTALECYRELTDGKDLLDYDPVKPYTNKLLDDYFEYKYIWRQIENGEPCFALDKKL